MEPQFLSPHCLLHTFILMTIILSHRLYLFPVLDMCSVPHVQLEPVLPCLFPSSFHGQGLYPTLSPLTEDYYLLIIRLSQGFSSRTTEYQSLLKLLSGVAFYCLLPATLLNLHQAFFTKYRSSIWNIQKTIRIVYGITPVSIVI